MTNNTNPLAQFYRQEKLFVALPSGGNFYGSEVVELNSDNEVGVKPMTAADEVMFRDPDALLNGEAIKKVITSCVPAVKNVDNLLSADIDTLMVAIRHVSYGDKLDVIGSCPNCKTDQNLSLDIGNTLSSVDKLDSEYTVELDSGLIASVRPYTHRESLTSVKATFEQTNIIKSIDNPSFTEEQKLEKMSQGIEVLSKLNFKMIAQAISKIQLPDGETEVTNTEQIHEFIGNIGRDQANRIQKKLDEINKIGIKSDYETVCPNEECKTKYTIPLDFNPATFFTESSQTQSPST
jgi:hypothetical protein